MNVKETEMQISDTWRKFATLVFGAAELGKRFGVSRCELVLLYMDWDACCT